MKGQKILIVDDETEFAETCAECLAFRGFDARWTGDARSAMEVINSGWHPAVVLLDLQMPEMNGLETLSLIKQFDQDIEVIIVTARGSTEDGIEGMQRGLFDYFMKPVEIEELVEKIHQALDKNKYPSPD